MSFILLAHDIKSSILQQGSAIRWISATKLLHQCKSLLYRPQTTNLTQQSSSCCNHLRQLFDGTAVELTVLSVALLPYDGATTPFSMGTKSILANFSAWVGTRSDTLILIMRTLNELCSISYMMSDESRTENRQSEMKPTQLCVA